MPSFDYVIWYVVNAIIVVVDLVFGRLSPARNRPQGRTVRQTFSSFHGCTLGRSALNVPWIRWKLAAHLTFIYIYYMRMVPLFRDAATATFMRVRWWRRRRRRQKQSHFVFPLPPYNNNIYHSVFAKCHQKRLSLHPFIALADELATKLALDSDIDYFCHCVLSAWRGSREARQTEFV